MVAEAIGLDDQAEIGPVEVDFDAGDDLFAQGLRKAGRSGDGTEKDLQVGIREEKGVPVEKPAQATHAGLPGKAGEAFPQFLSVDQVALVGLVDGSLEPSRLELNRQVDEGAGWGRYRNPVAPRHVALCKRWPAAGAYPRPAGFGTTPQADIDSTAVLSLDSP